MNLRFKLLSAAGIFAAAVGLSMMPVAAAGAQALAVQGTVTGVNVQLVGGSGSYAFNYGSAPVTGAPLCQVVAEVGTDDLGPEVAGSCSLNASGTYANIICGTGTTGGGALNGASDTATLSGEPEGGTFTTISYGITFVASVGVVLGTATGGEDSGTLGGVVQITPASGNCVSGVTSFTATLAVVSTT